MEPSSNGALKDGIEVEKKKKKRILIRKKKTKKQHNERLDEEVTLDEARNGENERKLDNAIEFLSLAKSIKNKSEAEKFRLQCLQICQEISSDEKRVLEIKAEANLLIGDVKKAREDSQHIESSCIEIEGALHELQFAICSPKAMISFSQVEILSKRIRVIAPLFALGQVTEAVEAYLSKRPMDAIDLINEALAGYGVSRGGGGYGAPPGKHNKTPNNASLYLFRARCHLILARVSSKRREQAAEARDDISRAATLLGIPDVLFASRIDMEICASIDKDDAAYLVRLRARCDLLAWSKTRPRENQCITLVSAAATLEAGGSADNDFKPTIDSLEAAEIEFDLAQKIDLDQNPKQATYNDHSWLEYDSTYQRFETIVLPKAKDATLSLSILPLPPTQPALVSMTILDSSSSSYDERKRKIRLALLRWHPDKATSFAHKFVPQDRDLLVSTSAEITRRILIEKKQLLLQSQ